MTEEHVAAIEEAIATVQAQGQDFSAEQVYQEMQRRGVRCRRSTVQAYVRVWRERSSDIQEVFIPSAMPVFPSRIGLPRLSREQALDRIVRMSPLIFKMVGWLETREQDTLYPYAVADTALGVKVQRYLPQLRKARQFIYDRDHKCIILRPNEGIIWVTESGKLHEAFRHIERGHKELLKGSLLARGIDLEKLPPEQYLLCMAATGISLAASVATAPKTVEKIITQKELQPILIDLREYADVIPGLLPPGRNGQNSV